MRTSERLLLGPLQVVVLRFGVDHLVPGVPLEYAEWPGTPLCKEPTRAERMVGYVTVRCAPRSIRTSPNSPAFVQEPCAPSLAYRRAL